VAVYFAGYMICMPLIMPLTDRFDARHLVIGGSLLSAAVTLAFPLLADDMKSAMLLRFVAGAAHGTFYPPVMRAMVDRLDDTTRP
jgi:predicted MFS family arabinose efflux permease